VEIDPGGDGEVGHLGDRAGGQADVAAGTVERDGVAGLAGDEARTAVERAGETADRIRRRGAAGFVELQLRNQHAGAGRANDVGRGGFGGAVHAGHLVVVRAGGQVAVGVGEDRDAAGDLREWTRRAGGAVDVVRVVVRPAPPVDLYVAGALLVAA